MLRGRPVDNQANALGNTDRGHEHIDRANDCKRKFANASLATETWADEDVGRKVLHEPAPNLKFVSDFQLFRIERCDAVLG